MEHGNLRKTLYNDEKGRTANLSARMGIFLIENEKQTVNCTIALASIISIN
jgi:hypothetical protein